MSFLNPVNEPVLRFKSTDAGAPQINYNARVAGDVKAVLKACLVTGYGSISSAGWTAVNEAGNVIEFVSPSVAMGDYRLGIDDTSVSITTWYYQHKDSRTNPVNNSPTKDFTRVDKSHVSNGWQLFITDLGLIFVESIYHTEVNKLSSRITYLGLVKSALPPKGGRNIMFANFGHDGVISRAEYLYVSTYTHFAIENYSSGILYGSHVGALGAQSDFDESVVDVISKLYVADASKKHLLAQVPGLLGVSIAKSQDTYGVTDATVDARPVLKITAGFGSSVPTALWLSGCFMIYADYWEY